MNLLAALLFSVFGFSMSAKADDKVGIDGAPVPSYEESQHFRRQHEARLGMDQLDAQGRELLNKPLVSQNGAAIFSGLNVSWPYPAEVAVARGEEISSEIESLLKRARWPIREISATDYSAVSANALTLTLRNQTFMRYAIDGTALKFQSSLSNGASGRDLVAIGDGRIDIYLGIFENSVPVRANRHLTHVINPAVRGEVLYAATRYDKKTGSLNLELVFRTAKGHFFAEVHAINEAWKNPVRLKQRAQIAQETFAAIGSRGAVPAAVGSCKDMFRSTSNRSGF